MQSMIGLSEALYSICAAILVIVPRTSSSSGVIGGDLAAPFRKCILIVVLMNVFRNVCFDDRRFRDPIPASSVSSTSDTEEFATFVYYALTSIESFFTTFLMLLMPYLLQYQLSALINIKPGRDLMPWLFASLLLDFSGVVAARFHPNLWSIKRLGDAIGSVPVMNTLHLFRRVNATRGGNNITIKTVEVLESISLIITVAAAAAYLFDDHQSNFNVAVRVSSIFVSRTRLMFHGLILNVMDEASQTPPSPPQSNEKDRNESPVDVMNGSEMGSLIVKTQGLFS